MDLKEIKEEIKKIKDPSEKVSYIEEKLDSETYKNIKNDLKLELANAIKENGFSRAKVNYILSYDSLSEGAEAIYFWLLDFMRDRSGLGMEDVIKTKDEYEAAVGSGYFGEMGTRASVMQERAMKMLATINTVVRSILNLLYDLKEFEIRLDTYKQLKEGDANTKESARLALKGLWMDHVDIKRGRGSINMLATSEMGFVTLRDAFMQANSIEDVKKLDLNDRVKRILDPRLSEYLMWEEKSDKELTKRYNIEKAYLKSQVASLKYYTKWSKPYLVAAKKLDMANFDSPNIVNAFNNMEIQLVLFGKTEIKPESVHPSFTKLDLKDKYYGCIEVKLTFRTVPHVASSQGGTSHYIHGGRTDVEFKTYVLKEKELEKIKEGELAEDMRLIEDMTDASLKEMQEDLDYYLKGEEKPVEEKKKKKPKFDNPFSGLFDGFKEIAKPMERVFKPLKGSSSMEYADKQIIDAVKGKINGQCFALYDVYKKAHKMLSW